MKTKKKKTKKKTCNKHRDRTYLLIGNDLILNELDLNGNPLPYDKCQIIEAIEDHYGDFKKENIVVIPYEPVKWSIEEKIIIEKVYLEIT